MVIGMSCLSRTTVSVTFAPPANSIQSLREGGDIADLVLFESRDAIADAESGFGGRAFWPAVVSLSRCRRHRASSAPRKPRGSTAKFGRMPISAPTNFIIVPSASSPAEPPRPPIRADWRRVKFQFVPSELVFGEVELDAVLRQQVVADHAVQFDAGEPHAVHAFDLKEVLDAALGVFEDDAALDLESVDFAQAASIRLDADFLCDFVHHEQGRGAGVENEIERPFAVDLGPDEHVLRRRQAIRNQDRRRFRLVGAGGAEQRE